MDEIELDLRSQYRAFQLFYEAVSERTTPEREKLHSPDQGFWIVGKNGSYFVSICA